ncbi:thioredoxin family protein [Neobacillus niacini]|uniref:thioredoxin family protein n=1 Tax=Neobacillus niacini TaxID=86668 RepID=UPI0028656264|nr:thioredoxin family protein [Neobacillus niacini]MDR7001608.1 thioredoxin-like negative regulator of GroEL [Neobacillus niacini]
MITIKKFSRPGCRPCTALANYLGDIDLFVAGVTLENVDITEHPEVIDKYNLNSVPVLAFFRNGVEVGRLVGLVGTEEILDAIEHAKVVR